MAAINVRPFPLFGAKLLGKVNHNKEIIVDDDGRVCVGQQHGKQKTNGSKNHRATQHHYLLSTFKFLNAGWRN